MLNNQSLNSHDQHWTLINLHNNIHAYMYMRLQHDDAYHISNMLSKQHFCTLLSVKHNSINRKLGIIF